MKKLSIILITVFLLSCSKDDEVRPTQTKQTGPVVVQNPLLREMVIAKIQELEAPRGANARSTALAISDVYMWDHGNGLVAYSAQIPNDGTQRSERGLLPPIGQPPAKIAVSLLYNYGTFSTAIKLGLIEYPYLFSGFRKYNFYGYVNGAYEHQLTMHLTTNGDATFPIRINPPSSCGQWTMDCISEWYGKKGWTSVWLTLGSLAFPEIAVGVVGGCAIACAVAAPPNPPKKYVGVPGIKIQPSDSPFL